MKEIFKILEKEYIKKIFEKKKDFYFPDFKKQKIVDLLIKKESPDWAKNSCLAEYKILFSDGRFKFVRATAHINGSKKRSFEIMKYLYQKSLSGNFFQIPRPLDYLEKTKTLLYEKVEGVPLSILLETKKQKLNELMFGKLAEFLFLLHSIKGIKYRVKTFGKEDYKLIFWQIKKILPEFSKLIPSLKKIAFLEKLKKPIAFLHGDFYPSNIIFGEKISLIDFDKSGRGSPFLDLLAFIYWFELPKIKPLKLSFGEIEKIKEIFLEKYCYLSKINFFKAKKELEKFKIKIFLDCLHYVTILAYHGWEKVDKQLKEEFRESVKKILEKIKEC